MEGEEIGKIGKGQRVERKRSVREMGGTILRERQGMEGVGKEEEKGDDVGREMRRWKGKKGKARR